ncbi:DUF4365 domain-containing protein [Desulfobacula sp.]|uniref:DUF4365 domain-containing protein n=1 Tax=Desulfobacula sp. TaxID=2593537 RepID=UPI0026345D01|nr:DUF4365 domain-containing protein [Desulfobacula sp.]
MNLPTKRHLTTIEREGVNYFRSIIENANCIFNEIDQRNDFGIDAIVELVDGEKVTGKSIAAQIKSGASYCTESTCKIPASKEHFNYWINHSLTVIGLVYDPDKKTGYWIDISNLLKHDRKRLDIGPYTIIFEKRDINEFDTNACQNFFLPHFLNRPINLSFERSVDFASSKYLDMHKVGLSSLLNNFRYLDKVWDLFFDLFMGRSLDNISGYLVYILSLIPGHPDIYWHSGNTIEEKQRLSLEEKIRQMGPEFFIRLLYFVDENGFYRGSLGQCVEAIISTIPTKALILSNISKDNSNDLEIRKSALMLYLWYTQKDSVNTLKELSENDSEISEFAEYLKSAFDECGYIDIFG